MNILIRGYIRAIKYLIDGIGEILQFFNFTFYDITLENIFKRLTPQEIYSIARDDFYMKSLKIYLDECRTKSGISLTGKILVTFELIHSIRSRYNLIKYLESNPDIENVEIKEPVFIVSFPRTGSSFLHCCLQEDDYWFTPEIWMQALLAESPSNPLSQDDIRKAMSVQGTLNIRNALVGWNRIQSAHNLHSRNSEDVIISCTAMGSFICQAAFQENLEDSLYLFDRLPQELRLERYNFLKKIWQVQKRNYPDRRLLAMAHFPANDVEVLIRMFPDARFVMLHRDPITSVKSIISLLDIGRTQYYNYQRGMSEKQVQRLCTYYTEGHTKFCQKREKIEKADGHRNRFIDISFPELVRDPFNCIEKIYRELNVTMSKDRQEKIMNYIRYQKEHSVGKHIYKKMNLPEDELKEEFKDYYKKFKNELGYSTLE